MEIDPITIGDRIRKLRKEKNWSQYDLAEKSGVARPVINLIENSKVKRVDYGNVIAIAKVFEVSPDWLTGNPTEKTDKDEIITDLELTILQLRDIIKRLRNL